METVIVKIIYTAQDPPGFEKDLKYEISKTFRFNKLPIRGNIILKDELIEAIPFDRCDWDPYKDEYTVYLKSSEGVYRYYHDDAKEIMNKFLGKYKQNGWTWKQL